MNAVKTLVSAGFVLVLGSAAPAFAAHLAIGAAGGVMAPEGTVLKPVYTWPAGGQWDPVDTSMGVAFHEPIDRTPRGYRYVYVRGYQIQRLRTASAARVTPHKVAAKTAKHKTTRHRGSCVTDLGFGRYDLCP